MKSKQYLNKPVAFCSVGSCRQIVACARSSDLGRAHTCPQAPGVLAQSKPSGTQKGFCFAHTAMASGKSSAGTPPMHGPDTACVLCGGSFSARALRLLASSTSDDGMPTTLLHLQDWGPNTWFMVATGLVDVDFDVDEDTEEDDHAEVHAQSMLPILHMLQRSVVWATFEGDCEFAYLVEDTDTGVVHACRAPYEDPPCTVLGAFASRAAAETALASFRAECAQHKPGASADKTGVKFCHEIVCCLGDLVYVKPWVHEWMRRTLVVCGGERSDSCHHHDSHSHCLDNLVPVDEFSYAEDLVREATRASAGNVLLTLL